EDAILYPDSPLPVVIFTVAMAAYQLFIAVSIWRSAGKYQGFKLWFVLARISTLGTFYTWARSGIIYFSAWAKVGLIYFTS
ncbi:MAG: hypothetical protein QGF68_18560, partial [Nitrospinota bacterium]|nr:hypothetical protein [Nitrospinota bacterium]